MIGFNLRDWSVKRGTWYILLPWKSNHRFLVRLVSEFHHDFSREEYHLPKGVTTILKMVATTSRVLFIAEKVIKQKSLDFDTSCQLMVVYNSGVGGVCVILLMVPKSRGQPPGMVLKPWKYLGYSLPTSTGFHAGFLNEPSRVSWLVNLTPRHLRNRNERPPKNKSLIRRLIEGNQWLCWLVCWSQVGFPAAWLF